MHRRDTFEGAGNGLRIRAMDGTASMAAAIVWRNVPHDLRQKRGLGLLGAMSEPRAMTREPLPATVAISHTCTARW
jgi:hypothetical protein